MRILSLFTIFAYSLTLSGQHPLIKKVSFDSQFGETRISKTLVDDNGFLWLGTDAGLFSFDGHEFSLFAHSDTLIQSEVTALYEDEHNRLWIGYNSGNIDYLDRGILKVWDIQEGLPKVPITGFSRDTNDYFWIATYGEGLYSYKGDKLYNFNTDDGLSSNDIYCLSVHSNGSVWLGTDQGLNICHWNHKNKVIEHHGMEQGIPDELILSIHLGEDEKVWIGTHNQGFGNYDPNHGIYTAALPSWSHGPINEITSLNGEKIFVGTEDQGLFSFDPPNQSLSNLSQQIKIDHRSISDMAIDKEMNLWVANDQPHLYLINNQFQYYNLEIGPIQSLCLDQQKQIWIGTSSGLYKKKLGHENNTAVKYLARYNLNIISLDIDDAGLLWIGTFGQGLYCYNPSTDQILSFTEESGLLNNSILSVHCQSNEVWLASLGGAFKINYDENIFEKSYSISSLVEGLGSSYIYQIFPDKKGNIWFATDGHGLSCLADEKIETFSSSNLGQPIKTVYSIAEDEDENIWFISESGDVYHQKMDSFVRFDKLKPGLNLVGITSTQSGEIVISHQDGLIIIDPATLQTSYLSEEFELSSLQPTLNSLVSDKKGNIWIGSNNRLISLNTLSPAPYAVPLTQITEISLFDKPIHTTPPLKFKPKENFISFNYVGVSFLNPQKIRYRYMLEGYDRTWNYTRDQRASYSHLPSGEYTFKVQASTSDQFDNLLTQTSSFQIKKAIYDRVGFWVFMVLISYRLIYLFGKSREKKLKLQAKRKREQIEFQYHQLQNQINPHFLFNSYNTLLNIIEEKPEVASEYVEKLSDFYRQIITIKEQDVVTLEEEIKLVKNYFYLLQNRYGDNIQLKIDTQSKYKFIAPMSLQMLVENAVKHNIISKKHPLQVDILEDHGKIIVKNNLQPKINPERSTGFGLKNIKERYKLLSGQSIEIKESLNEFWVILPLVDKRSYV